MASGTLRKRGKAWFLDIYTGKFKDGKRERIRRRSKGTTKIEAQAELDEELYRLGDDRACIFKRQGLVSQILWQGRETDTVTQAGLVARFEDTHQADAVFVDQGAMGAGVIDQLRNLGRSPIPVNFGGKSIKSQYVNKRAEMWGEMGEWLKDGGAIPEDSNLFDDLTAPEYTMTLKGQIQLESKKDMKARGLASPDLADALALTFAQPVYKAKGKNSQSDNLLDDEEYDPLA